jgi:hypothetical protein
MYKQLRPWTAISASIMLFASMGCATTKIPWIGSKVAKQTDAQRYAEQYVASNPNAPILETRSDDSSSGYSPPRRRQAAASGSSSHSGCNH